MFKTNFAFSYFLSSGLSFSLKLSWCRFFPMLFCEVERRFVHVTWQGISIKNFCCMRRDENRKKSFWICFHSLECISLIIFDIVCGNRTYDNSTKEILKLQNTNQHTLWRKSAQLKMSQKSLFRLHKNKSCTFLLFPFVCVRISLCVVNVKYEAVRIVWDNFSLSEKTNNEKKNVACIFDGVNGLFLSTGC